MNDRRSARQHPSADAMQTCFLRFLFLPLIAQSKKVYKRDLFCQIHQFKYSAKLQKNRCVIARHGDVDPRFGKNRPAGGIGRVETLNLSHRLLERNLYGIPIALQPPNSQSNTITVAVSRNQPIVDVLRNSERVKRNSVRYIQTVLLIHRHSFFDKLHNLR